MMQCRRSIRILILLVGVVALAACGGGANSGGNQTTSGTNGSGNGSSTPQTIQYQPSPLTVTPAPETSRAVTQTIGTAGGTLSVTDAAGTTYTLQIPKDALIAATDITLTPLNSVAGLPLSGPNTLGVQVAPEGVELLKDATLTITPTNGVQLSSGLKAVGYAYHGTGDEFYLEGAQVAADHSQATLAVHHFSGYGLSGGTDQEIADQQANHAPTAVSDWADQENAVPQSDPVEQAIVQTAFVQDESKIAMGTDNVDLMDQALLGFVDWERQYNIFLARDPSEAQGDDNIISSDFYNALIQALSTANMKCQDHDLYIIRDLLRWNFIATVYPQLEGRAPANLLQDAKDCARFELDFDSDVQQNSGSSGAIEMDLTAKVPVTAALDTGVGVQFYGQATSSYKTAKFDENDPSCTSSATGHGDLFEVTHLNLGLNLSQAGTQSTDPAHLPLQAFDLAATVQPNKPTETLHISCPNNPPLDETTNYWLGAWAVLHESEFSKDLGGYNLVNHWQAGANDIIATATYDQSDSATTLSEHTVVTLRHTPLPFPP